MLISPGCVCCNSNEIWIQSGEINAIFSIDAEKNLLLYRGSFKDCLNKESWKSCKAIIYKEKVYFFSGLAYEFWCFDIKEGSIKNTRIQNRCYTDSCYVSLDGDCAWIIPRSFMDPIVECNLKNDKQTIHEWGNLSDLSDYCSITEIVSKNGFLYFATRKISNIQLITVNTRNCCIECEPITDIKTACCLSVIDDTVYLCGEFDDGSIGIKNIESPDCKPIKCIPEIGKENQSYDILFSRVINIGDKLFFIPCHSKASYIYDLNTSNLQRVDYPSVVEHHIRNERALFFECCILNKIVYLFSCELPFMVYFDCDSQKFECRILEVKESNYELNNQLFNEIMNGSIHRESALLSLNCYISALETDSSIRK